MATSHAKEASVVATSIRVSNAWAASASGAGLGYLWQQSRRIPLHEQSGAIGMPLCFGFANAASLSLTARVNDGHRI